MLVRKVTVCVALTIASTHELRTATTQVSLSHPPSLSRSHFASASSGASTCSLHCLSLRLPLNIKKPAGLQMGEWEEGPALHLPTLLDASSSPVITNPRPRLCNGKWMQISSSSPQH